MKHGCIRKTWGIEYIYGVKGVAPLKFYEDTGSG